MYAGLPRSVKSQGKPKFFQSQGKVSEFCIWSGKFKILLKVREKSGKSQGDLYHFRYYEHQVTRTTKGNRQREKHIKLVNKKK